MIEISEFDAFSQSSAYVQQTQIDTISCQDLSYEQFHQKYMYHNVPLVIKSIPQKWKSMQTWIKPTEESSQTLNIDYLKHIIPNHKVPIADCTKELLNSHEKFEMNFHDFLDYWAAQMTAETICENKLWYLKDWHLKKLEHSYNFYEIPQYFGSDWLNEYLRASEQDDYMFVYMGPKGTWTPLHSDVFSSFSWSTNILGTKKWILIYPSEENKLLDNFNNLPFNITEEMLRRKSCNYVCLIQNAGDTIFVPSGWYHQVHNIDHTISINHNFFNGCNVSYVWSALLESYQKVLKEVDDCSDMDDFEGHCQMMLKALHGMNFQDFFDLLKVVVDNRVKCFRSQNQLLINGFVLGRSLCIFDLKSCLSVLNKIQQIFKEINYSVEAIDVCDGLKLRIVDELKNHEHYSCCMT